MSIEGLGKRLQAARLSRGLSLEQAARLTKIRQSRLTEIEAEDFTNFPSMAYAKGFLQIYGKFLNIDVSPYLEAFEDSDHVTVDGYSYLQDNSAPRRTRAAAPVPSAGAPTSILPLIIGIIVCVGGIWLVKLVLDVQRITPRESHASPAATPAATVANIAASSPEARSTPVRSAVPVNVPVVLVPTATPALTPAEVALATTPSATVQPIVRRAQPVRPEELAALEASGQLPVVNRVAIRPLKRTYVQVTVDGDPSRPAFERWLSPSDGAVEFRGHHFNVRVLDRDAVQISKNGRVVAGRDADVTVE